MKRKLLIIALLAAVLLLCGCDMRTVDEMYALPDRPDSDYNLQNAINKAMSGLDYCAPKNGKNQQIVQSADIDGNGEEEYLLFAKGDDAQPLKILVFDKQKNAYNLVNTLAFNGTAFDRVEYVQMDDRPGVELVVGCQLNNQITGNLSVYSFRTGRMEQLLSSSYSQFLTADLDSNSLRELFVIRPGAVERGTGIAELYRVQDGAVNKSVEMGLSASADGVLRVLQGRLQDQKNGIFVFCAGDTVRLSTDVFTLDGDALINISLKSPYGGKVETMNNYYVYPSDIDGDGIIEIPRTVEMVSVTQNPNSAVHKLICWYGMLCSGQTVDKLFTYHSFIDGWFVELQPDWVNIITVARQDNKVDFFCWDKEYRVPIRMFSVFLLTGQNKDMLLDSDSYIVLYKTDNVIYCGEITSTGEKYGLDEQKLIESFHLIQQEVRDEGSAG